MPDPIKEAFAKVKEDIENLKSQIQSLTYEIESLREVLYSSFSYSSYRLTPTNSTLQQTDTPTLSSSDSIDFSLSPRPLTNSTQNPTDFHFNSTVQQSNPTDSLIKNSKMTYKCLKEPNFDISTGNNGVPTDRQTNQQTDNKPANNSNYEFSASLMNVSEVVSSLDTLQKEVRFKFKKLTKQEMSVFSLIYQLEEQGFIVDYPLLAQRLSLSESSIRDYTQRIIKKGIPLIKTKENNKKIILSIEPNLKKLVPLSALLKIREI